jgi:monooxygenase
MNLKSENDLGDAEDFDVVVIGAGISGICAGYRLQERRKKTSYVILEKRQAVGGTWDLFRFPGVRADSDIQTMEFPFRPWYGAETLAPGPAIRGYMSETAQMYGIEDRIRFGHRVVRASWSSEQSRWTVETEIGEPDGTTRTATFRCRYILSCAGYYDGDGSYTPDFAGIERFGGRIVHPQHWPEDLDYAGKRVIVIGSGATAMTLVPAMARTAGHVTMLQRSPSYVMSFDDPDGFRARMAKLLPQPVAHRVVRWRNIVFQIYVLYLSVLAPKLVKAMIRKKAVEYLGPDYDVDTHFGPRYNPWDQRLCAIPDGDLFVAIAEKRADVVTDKIATFTEDGIETESGQQLSADLVVTATGFEMRILPRTEVLIDGEPVDLADTIYYKGVLLSGIPNFAHVTGYPQQSYTLKADISCRYVMRVLDHLDEHGYAQVTPVRADTGPTRPSWLLSSGYIQRAKFPRQGTRRPWKVYRNFLADSIALTWRPVAEESLEFSRGAAERKVAKAS